MYQEILSQNTCCFTGHRSLPEQDMLYIRRMLRQTLEQLIENNIDTFIAGGALGFDTLAAQEVLRMRVAYPHIRLVLAVPCRGQDSRWSAAQRAAYASIMAKADLVRYTGSIPSREAMFTRNRFMVDHSSCCVCYLDNSSPRSGTSYTVRYAQSRGLKLINLASGPDAPRFADEAPGERTSWGSGSTHSYR